MREREGAGLFIWAIFGSLHATLKWSSSDAMDSRCPSHPASETGSYISTMPWADWRLSPVRCDSELLEQKNVGIRGLAFRHDSKLMNQYLALSTQDFDLRRGT
jgi:hypothetical protein